MENRKRKYSVLIADDEYWTREKLRKLIQWDQYDLLFLEPAVDGEDALKKVDDYRPDILIADINMPFINGIELLKEVNKKYPQMITFVVSGYDDFKYVKGTFMAGAINYLVKPITKIDLVQALVLALEKISEHEKERLELLKAMSALQDREFSQMIQKQDMPFAPSFSANGFGELAGMSLMMIKIHNFHEILKNSGNDVNVLSYNIKKEIRDLFGNDKLILFNNIYRINEFFVVTEAGDELLSCIAEKLRVKLSYMMNAYMTICITGHSYSIESIHNAYVEAIGLFMTRRYCMQDEIILQRENDEMKFHPHFDADCERQLKIALDLGKEETVRDVLFEQTGLSCCVQNNWSYLEVKQTIRQVFNFVINYTITEGKKQTANDMESYGDIVERAVETLDYDILRDTLTDTITYLMPEKKDISNDKAKDIVMQVEEWLKHHYMDEVSLTFLAEKYHIAPSYLSKVFRQETGVNLISYVTQKRMEKAIDYIKNSEINLTEISWLVGYDDYTYFSRVFKKHTGVNPRDYRNQ